MKPELQNKLIEKYPLFFSHLGDKKIISELKDINLLVNQGELVIPIQFGFECKDGWYWLINNLMANIYNYCEWNKIDVPSVLQIKEKFGRLCFYIQGGNELINGMIWMAKHLSYDICEQCGTTKNVGHTEGWVYTICEQCRQTYKSAKELNWIQNEK